MLVHNPYHLERMEEDELAFLERRYIQESKQFYLGMKWTLLVMMVFPLFVVLFHQCMDKKDGLSNREIWIYMQCGTLILYIFVFLGGYLRLLLPYVRDLKTQNKVVEQAMIIDKKFMPQNNSYHFYLNSQHCYSIEVSADIFESLQVQDEICVEYAGHTEIYLGYF